jgi:hypothetical protein
VESSPPKVSTPANASEPPSPESRGKLLRGLTIKYGSLIVVLSVISFVIIPNLANFMGPFNLLIVPTLFLLLTMYFGRVFSILSHKLVGEFLIHVLAGVIFLYFFLNGLDALIGADVSTSAAGTFGGLEPSILVFITCFFVYSFGGKPANDGNHYPVGLSATKMSGALLLLSLGLAVSELPPTSWLQYTFTYPALVLFALSAAPIIAFSKTSSYRNAGMYLLKSSDRWTAVAGLIGFVVSILAIPKPPSLNYYIFIGILVVAGLLICYVGYTIYSLGTARINSIRQEIYAKYQHELKTNFRQDFDFLYAAGKNFLLDGETGGLLVALTVLLSNSGRDYEECANVLEPLIKYKALPVYEYRTFGLRAALEVEAVQRESILNSVMLELSQMTASTSVR